MKEKPDLVLKNGEFIPEGSGGNHKYSFKDGDYIYQCAILNVADLSPISPEALEILDVRTIPPALLTIFKDGNELFKENAKIL